MIKIMSRRFSQKLLLVLFVWGCMVVNAQATDRWWRAWTQTPIYMTSQWHFGPNSTQSIAFKELCNKIGDYYGTPFRGGSSCYGGTWSTFGIPMRLSWRLDNPNPPPPPEPEVTYDISIKNITSSSYKNYITSMNPSLTKSFTVEIVGSDGKPGNIPIDVKVKAVEGTGGHVQAHHDARNPNHSGELKFGTRKGVSLKDITINGSQEFTFTSPKSSGDHLIEITCPNHTCTQSKPDKVWVGIKDLKPLPSSQLYKFIGDTDAHPDNHYVSDLAAKKIDNIAFVYNEDFPDFPILHINDISLERGGLFDNSGEWTQPHQLHRAGMDIDIRAHENLGKPGGNVPVQNYKEFVSISKQHGCRARIHLGGAPGEHFHLYCNEKYGK